MTLCGCDGRTADSSRQDGDAIGGRLHSMVAGQGFQHSGVRGLETRGRGPPPGNRPSVTAERAKNRGRLGARGLRSAGFGDREVEEVIARLLRGNLGPLGRSIGLGGRRTSPRGPAPLSAFPGPTRKNCKSSSAAAEGTWPLLSP
jgi:hypothetical protein